MTQESKAMTQDTLPSPDLLRQIAKDARNQSFSSSDDASSVQYVLAGWKAAIAAQAEPRFLAKGARYKVCWDDSDFYISGLPHDLNGRWVALVAADDDCHLQAAPTAQEPLIANINREIAEFHGITGAKL